MNAIYRVILKISYREAYFDFVDAAEACGLAKTMIEHLVSSDDENEKAKIIIEIIDEGFGDCEESD